MVRRSATLLVSMISMSALGCSSAPADPPEAPVVSETEPVRVEYRGTVALEAHLARPGETVPVELGWAQACQADVCRVERTTGTGERANTVTIWSTPAATWIEGAPTRIPEEQAENHRRLLRLFGAEEERPSVEVSVAHPRLGTVVDSARYADFGPQGAPGKVSIEFHDADIAWSGTLELHGIEPAEIDVPVAPEAPEFPEPSITALGEGIWDVRVPARDARSFVVEFPSFVTVIEAPWSSAVGERVVDLIAAEIPDKPIRYVLYSHHHPHYTGGLRAFIAAGASVVAPKAHADFIRSIAALDFATEPDRLARAGVELALISYEDTFTIAESGQSLRVIDIGAASNHTAAYNMFWLPRDKTLIQGDLGWFVSPQGEVRVGARSAGLLTAIDAHGLGAQRLMQTWPVNTQDPVLEMRVFRAVVEG